MFTGILLYKRFSEYELSVLLSVLHQSGKKVIYIGLDEQVVKGEAGLTCVPETTIHEVDLETLDSIVLPGVDDFEHLVEHQDLAAFLVRTYDNKRVIAAISSAPYLLSMSGLLSEKKYTTGLTVDQRNFLGTFNEENYVETHVVVDETIITAKGSAFIKFAFAFGDRLQLNYQTEWYGLGGLDI
ncbi:4-methyl-5(B-hydroxyethyl)-thiazole monophosphate biosynthesis protein [Sutcliffiella horikoshii]|uniref:4-methyl-5(B-hydroxyethyl)-thiazole monophosphate biosynthesis protein n=1 Tax=Sutcliffiella horikoshii TaxID=79883 RepID=A0AA95B5M3_9BACI|nr:DJ-1/PfpI family protein [Sutcliffiella horikoshii]TYS58449.1 4-methyl-5(B-hydroxyethyl)-thiazole monophosphate biosynthesis protein [Sutcliffiella horikoshii]